MARYLVLLFIFNLALAKGALAVDASQTRRASLFAALDRRIRARIAHEPGAVIVRRANGITRRYPAAADTDTARGAALSAAFAIGFGLRNSTVFLGPGTYVVAAGLRGFTGTKLYGSGRDLTTIRVADGSLSANYFVFRCVEAEDPLTGYRYSNHCEIQDVTLDVNRQNQLGGIFYGVGAQLYGSNSIMRRVRCVNAGGNGREEIFCLSSVGSGGAGGTFNTGLVKHPLIDRCEVNGVAPGFSTVPISITGIAMNGSYTPDPTKPSDGWVVNGRITDCSVYGVTCDTGLQAFQISAASRTLIEDCTTYGNTARYVWGFYTDTGPLQNVMIARNVFDDVDIGARFLCDSASYHSNTTVIGNDLHIRATANSTGKAGIEYSGNNRTTWPRIIGNRITLVSAFPGSTGVNLVNASGAFILANTIAGFATPISLQNLNNAVVRGNFDGMGDPVDTAIAAQLP